MTIKNNKEMQIQKARRIKKETNMYLLNSKEGNKKQRIKKKKKQPHNVKRKQRARWWPQLNHFTILYITVKMN